MENIIEQIYSNPVYMAIAVILGLLMVYGIVKRIIKLVIFIGIVLVLYVVYLNYTGQEVPATTEELKKSVTENVEIVKETEREVMDEKVKAAKDELLEELEEKSKTLKENLNP